MNNQFGQVSANEDSLQVLLKLIVHAIWDEELCSYMVIESVTALWKRICECRAAPFTSSRFWKEIFTDGVLDGICVLFPGGIACRFELFMRLVQDN